MITKSTKPKDPIDAQSQGSSSSILKFIHDRHASSQGHRFEFRHTGPGGYLSSNVLPPWLDSSDLNC